MAQRQSFMQAFNPYLQNSATMISKAALQWAEDERERKRSQEESKKQNNILSQLVSGTKPTFNYAGKFSPLVQQQAPLTQQDYVNLSSGASDDTLQRYNFIKEMTKQPEKKQKKTVRIGDQLFEESPDYENKPIGDPLFNFPEKPKEYEESEFIDASTVSGLERFKGYTVERKVVKDKDGNFVRYGNIGNPFKPSYSTNSNGKKVYDLDDYKQTYGVFNAKATDITVKMAKYLAENPDGIDVRGNAYNKDMDNAEITFYNKMIPDARNYVDRNFYSQVKDSGFDEYKDRKELLDAYLGDLEEDYINGNIEIDLSNYTKPDGVTDEEFKRQVMAETYKSAQLWGKLKLKRL